MKLFIIAANFRKNVSLAAAVKSMGGKPLTANCWLVPSSGSADPLCRRLRSLSSSTVTVCAADDWSYR